MPINDTEMNFDKINNQYVLTYEGLENGIFLDEPILQLFAGMTNFEQFSKEISEDVYNYIQKHKFIWDRKPFLNYIHDNDELYRNHIKRALLFQFRYAVRSGGNLLKDMHGIDLERARFVDINRMRGDVGISPATQEELKLAGLLSTAPLRR